MRDGPMLSPAGWWKPKEKKTVHLTDNDLATLQDMLNHAKATLPLHVTLKRVVAILSLLDNEKLLERYPRLAQVKAEAEQTLIEVRRILEED